MNENILREQLKTFLTKEERSIAYVARQIDLSRTSLSLWLKNKRELSVVVLEKIDNFIKEKAR
ncbi:helix-turn-helix domain-containing protein [Clostridium paraputrificum]|uniref:helix-turn-helix domain-containing protein n=1 Tax=Clostridium paraputrificum TaxID=29363 RepID=UPI00232F351F|nr:helix-turn-helix domain-containing protein [Clostridium paraputrificum]MDB2071402.1 helix-turn-helix domain-containing protein [Clostridium paraputrificum]MDB2081685.1 helix-turn-helix domain-containing protein [Clostridium paraputrificum]